MATSDRDDGSGEASRAGGLPAGLEERTVAAGEVIVRQGQPADRFYVILSGECEVLRDRGSDEQSLSRLGPGRFFGETGLLAGVPRTATVVAVGEVRLLTLSRADFRAALAGTSATAEDLARRIYEGHRGNRG
jgi:CRP-like cAMP-binding protein